MAANNEDTKPTTQKFSKGERSIPHHSQKASKYYPAEDVAVPKKVRYERRMRSMEEEDGRSARVRQKHALQFIPRRCD
jgi:large subunit ribosomal protein L6e